MFNYSKVKNYQKRDFPIILYQSYKKFNVIEESETDIFYRKIFNGVEGNFLTNRNKKNDDSKNRPLYSDLIIEQVMFLGNAIEEGHYIVVDKDLNIENPVIKFLNSQREVILKDTEIKIDKNNINLYKDRLEKFLVLALNIDPFIRINADDILLDEYQKQVFCNNLKIVDVIADLNIQYSFENSDLSNKLNGAFHLMEEINDNTFNKINIGFDITNFTRVLNKSIDFNLLNYNTSDRMTLILEDYDDNKNYTWEHNYPSTNNDVLNHSYVYYEEYLLVNEFTSRKEFFKEYQTDYFMNLKNDIKKIALKLLFNSKIESKHSFIKDSDFIVEEMFVEQLLDLKNIIKEIGVDEKDWYGFIDNNLSPINKLKILKILDEKQITDIEKIKYIKGEILNGLKEVLKKETVGIYIKSNFNVSDKNYLGEIIGEKYNIKNMSDLLKIKEDENKLIYEIDIVETLVFPKLFNINYFFHYLSYKEEGVDDSIYYLSENKSKFNISLNKNINKEIADAQVISVLEVLSKTIPEIDSNSYKLIVSDINKIMREINLLSKLDDKDILSKSRLKI